MGAKTALVVYADGDVPELLKAVGAPDPERTAELVRRLYPGQVVEEAGESTLWVEARPPEGLVYAGCWPGVEVVCDRRVMVDRPTSELPPEVLAAGAGRRRMVLHAMHSVVDWLAFAVWEDGRLVRALSVSPDDGVIEDVGEPFAFELPYRAGERALEDDEDDGPYPLPYHPLELAEDALRGLVGFVMEDWPKPGDLDAGQVRLLGFRVRA
ncbi:DUF6928 family protein [Kitasatospora sp. NPDC096147]|uniref:DUF6928 family protein n=1 Tax=Kitasatospora sp. NPDC096147 TaxID=3364093 RepID=UPI0037FD730F